MEGASSPPGSLIQATGSCAVARRRLFLARRIPAQSGPHAGRSSSRGAPPGPVPPRPPRSRAVRSPPGRTKTGRSVAGGRPHLGRLGPPAWGGPFRALRCSQREPRQSCDTAPSGKLEIREENKEGWKGGGGLCGFTCRQEHAWVGAMGHQVTGGVSTRLRGLHTQASCGCGDQRWRPGTYHSVPP